MSQCVHILRLMVCVTLLGGCSGEPYPIVIGYHSTLGSPSLAIALAQAEFDSIAAEGGLAIEVRGSPGPDGAYGRDLPAIVAEATRLRDQKGLVGVVAPGSSSAALVVAPVFRDAGVPIVNAHGTARSLQEAGPWIFSLPANDSIEGVFIADFVGEQLSANSAGVLYIVQEYGLGLRAGVAAGLRRVGVDVVAEVVLPHDIECPTEEPNPYDEALGTLMRQGVPDVLIVAGRQREVGCTASALAARGIEIPVVGGDAALFDDVMRRSARGSIESIYGVSWWHPSRANDLGRVFAQRFEAMHGVTPNHGQAMGYDAIMLLAAAAREVGPDRSAIQNYLSTLGTTRSMFDGITGPVGFGADSPKPLLMTRLIDGEVVPVFGGG